MTNQKAFTLMELLIVVLIVGILSAIALPQYNKAVLKSRYTALILIAKGVWEGNEVYYMEHGEYATELDELVVKGQKEYPDGTQVKLGDEAEYAYVKVSNPLVNNNYIAYQTHSENYPGDIHCEAKTGDAKAQQLCQSLSSQEPIGETITSGFTTYIISGSGVRFPSGAMDIDCKSAEDLGLTCSVIKNADGSSSKRVCTVAGSQNICRIQTTDALGNTTRVTCKTDSEGKCVSDMSFTTYDANGKQLTWRQCSSVNSDGSCANYSVVQETVYDEEGRPIVVKACVGTNINPSTGECTGYDYIGM